MKADNNTADGGDSTPEHVAGEWHSVPELRLRDHRFIVPLDYSRGPHSSPKISVFAREVVAGDSVIVIVTKTPLFWGGFYGFDLIAFVVLSLPLDGFVREDIFFFGFLLSTFWGLRGVSCCFCVVEFVCKKWDFGCD